MTAGKVRVAVVGTGRWAQVAHIPGWLRDPRAEVVALADVSEPALAEAAAEFGVARAVTDYRELLDDPDIDVVDVVTGNRPHFQISWDALSAGKHVLCEKPVHADYRRPGAAGAGRRARPADQARLHVPVRARGAVREVPDRLRVRRRAVHVQRLRAEQPVDRPGDAAAPDRPGCRPRRDRRVLDRGLRRADHRHHALVARRAADRGRRHHAQLRAGADGPRYRPDDQGQHRRRRHVDRGVRRPARWRRSSPPTSRSATTPASRPGSTARRARSSSGWWTSSAAARRSRRRDQGRGRVHRGRDPGRVLPAWRALRRDRGSSCSTPAWSPTSSTRSPATARPSQGDFAQGALVQETINAFEQSFRRRAWVNFPLATEPDEPAAAEAAAREGRHQRGPPGHPGADRRGLAAAGRPARLPGRPGRPAVRAARHGRHDARRALRRPGDRVRAATTWSPAPRSGTATRPPTWRCSS